MVELIQMHFNFGGFFDEQLTGSSEKRDGGGEGEFSDYENMAVLSKSENLYMKSYDANYCFMLHFPSEFVENKCILSANLLVLTQFITELKKSFAS